MKTQMKKTEMKMTLKKITSLFITINTLLNRVSYTHILVNSECLCFGMMTKKTAEQNKLKWFPVSSQQIIDVISKPDTINKIVKAYLNINEHTEICYFYIKSDNLKYNLILDRLWLNRNDVQVITKKRQFILTLQVYMLKAQKTD